MEIRGKIIHILPLQGGQTRAGGEWKKQEFVLETEAAQYPKKVCFHLWGDKVDQYPLALGDDIVASVEVESREYNGRWYTDVRAWKIDKATVAQPVSSVQAVPPVGMGDAAFFAAEPSGSSNDDLPF